MELNLTGSSEKVILNFDACGNTYFHLKSKPDKIYELSIDNQNLLELFKTNSSLDELYENPQYGILKYTDDPKSLKGESLRQMIEEENEKQEDENYDEDDEAANEYYKQKYFHEDDQFFEDYDEKENNENDNNNEDDVNDGNEEFIFLTKSDKIGIYNCDDINALYETIVYDGNAEHAYAIFKTKLVGNLPLYRLNIFNNDSIIKFRAIGSTESVYMLAIENGELRLIT